MKKTMTTVIQVDALQRNCDVDDWSERYTELKEIEVVSGKKDDGSVQKNYYC